MEKWSWMTKVICSDEMGTIWKVPSHSSDETYVVAIDGFIHREGLMRKVGCICTRKFVSDVQLVKQAVYSINKLKKSNTKTYGFIGL